MNRFNESLIVSVATALTSRLRHALAIALIVSLLTVSTLAASQTVVDVARDARVSFGFWYRAGGLKERHCQLNANNAINAMREKVKCRFSQFVDYWSFSSCQRVPYNFFRNRKSTLHYCSVTTSRVEVSAHTEVR